MNCTRLITPQTKFQAHSLKDEREGSFLVSSHGIVKYEILVMNILRAPISIVLKH